MNVFQKHLKFNKQEFTDFNKNTIKLVSLIFATSFKTTRTYIYNFLIPTLIFICTYSIICSFGSIKFTSLDYVSGLAILLIGPLMTLIGISSLITNWRESVFIKQFKIFKFKKSQLIFSILIYSIVITIISYVWLIIVGVIFDLFLDNPNFTSSLQLITKFHQIIGIFLTLVLYAILNFSIAYIISFLFKSPILIQTLNVCIISFLFIFSNIISPNLITSSNFSDVLDIVGYFDPLRMIQWLLFISYTNMINDAQNVRDIISNPYSDLPFTFKTQNPNYIFPLVLSIAFIWTTLLFIIPWFIKIKKI